MSVPSMRTASSAYQRKNSAAYAASPRASRSDLPFSADISRANWLGPLRHQLERLAQDLGALPRRGRRPAGQRGVRGADRVKRVLHGAVRDLRERLLGGGVEHGERAAAPAPPHSPPMSSPVGTSIPVSAVRSAATACHSLI